MDNTWTEVPEYHKATVLLFSTTEQRAQRIQIKTARGWKFAMNLKVLMNSEEWRITTRLSYIVGGNWDTWRHEQRRH